MKHRVLSSLAVASAIAAPGLAVAQVFTVTAQQGAVASFYSAGSPASQSQTGVLTSLALSAVSSQSPHVGASVTSTISATQMGISAGVGVNLPTPPSGSTPPGYPYGYPYGYGGASLSGSGLPSGGGNASISVDFTIHQDVDVSVALTDLYASIQPGSSLGSSFSSTLGLYRKDGSGLTAVIPRGQLAQLTHLSAGAYELSGAVNFADHTYNGLAGGGFSILISAAVPEAHSTGAMALGLAALAWATRRRRQASDGVNKPAAR